MIDLYDALIEGIPEEKTVDDVVALHHGAMVRSGENVGFSEFRSEWDTRPMLDSGDKTRKTLKELAAGVKSWNFTEAAMGVAAMNAYYNTPAMAEKNGLIISSDRYVEDRNADPFIAHQTAARGKKVVVIGRFPYMEQLLRPVCDLYIVNRHAYQGDYPESAAEYLVPGSDFVFIGVMSFLDKSLPRILELAGDAYVGLVGPVTVLSPILFDYGVDELDGFIPKNMELAEKIQKGQMIGKIYMSGEKVSLKKTDYLDFISKKSE